MKNLFESILDDFENLEKSQDKELVGEWFKENVKGKYKIVVLKNNTVKVWGDILIKDYKEDNFPYTISFMSGNVSIEKCPNITSINGLFADLMTIEGNLTINNCPKLTSLEGCPMIVHGALSLTGNSSLKSLEGAPEIVHGTTYVMKNGKRFSKEQVEKHVKMPMRIVCSIEEEDVLVEGLVNEALNEPHLLELVDRMKACKMDIKTLLFNWLVIEWDTIDSSNVTEYDKIDNKVLTICRNMLSGRGDRGIILLRNSNGEYQNIISYRKEILVIRDYSQDRWYSAGWIDGQTTELIEYIKKADSIVVITWDSVAMSRRNQKRISRGEARYGMVQNTPEYYEQVAQENRERYKKILAQNRANGSDKDFEKIDKDIDAILTKVMQMTRDLRKNFKPNNSGTNYHFDISKIEELNKQIYDQRQWNSSRHGGGYYSGEHGLLVLYNYYTTYTLKVKNSGDNYYEREARKYKEQLLQKIKDLKSELGM